jgi:hypothetical protein
VKKNSSSIQVTSSLSRDIITDTQDTFELEFCNDGVLASGEIQVQLPDVEWVQLSSPNPIASLDPEECTTISLIISIASTNKRAEVQVRSTVSFTDSHTRPLIHYKYRSTPLPQWFSLQYKSHLLQLSHQQCLLQL